MEANKFMLGDWVINNEEPTKINYLHNGKIGTENEYFIEYCELSPIPLTPELFLKNGFERRGGISYHKSIAGLIIHHWNDELCFLNYSKKNIPPIMIPFHYVHELQHALRLCGLTDLADSLKI